MASKFEDYLKILQDHVASLKKPSYGVLGDLAGAYGSLALGNQQADAYGNLAGDYEQQSNALKTQMDNMPTLEAMYGQNSPYAQQLEKQLAAKDAAAGRNSQYGPRLVQLQAALADKGSQYAQQQASMANAYNTARANANNARMKALEGQSAIRGQQLGSLFKIGESTGILPALNRGLDRLFGNDQSVPMSESPYAGGGNYGGYTTGSDQNNTGPSNEYTPTANDYSQYQSPSSGPTYQTTGAPTDTSNMYFQNNGSDDEWWK